MAIKEFALQRFNETASKLLSENGRFFVQQLIGNDSIVYAIESDSIYRTTNKQTVTVAKVKEGGKIEYISFSDKYAPLFDKAGISHSEADSSHSIRMSEMEFAIATSSPDFPLIIEHLVLQSFNFATYGCCGRYLECSNAKKCVHDDIFYATASCQYKRHLDKGEIFYGDNKTV